MKTHDRYEGWRVDTIVEMSGAISTGKFFEVTHKCMMEPHRHRFCCFLFCLITRGEWFFLYLVYENYLKLYPWNIVHPNSPCKPVLVNLLFSHCLIVEGSQLFYIVSLIVWLVLLDVECFGLQELFEGWGCVYLHKIEHFFPVCLEPNDGYSHHTRYTIV